MVYSRKAIKIRQKRNQGNSARMQRKAEELSYLKRDHDPMDNIICRINSNTCAAKHVSVIQRTALFHPMNESKKVRSMLSMQRQYGNRFVQRVIARNAIQTKLKIGQPGGKYEQEADRVADQVMQMPEPQAQQQISEEEEPVQAKPVAGQITPLVQRQDDEEEELQTKLEDIPHIQPQEEEDIDEKEKVLQTKRASGQRGELTPNAEIQINAIEGSGRPLLASTRAFFEPRFGYDFGHVRVHTGTAAHQAARVVKARAFTKGCDIVFGVGKYQPATREGERLLAHELAHVIQQANRATSLAMISHKGSRLLINRNTNTLLQMQPGTSQTRQSRAVQAKWTRLRRNRWKATASGASLETLSYMVSGNRHGWMYIKPVKMGYPAFPYWKHISPGDIFNVSKLVRLIRRRRRPKWTRVGGQRDIWGATRSGASLRELARKVSGRKANWVCIKPLRMAYPAHPYQEHVSPGDVFDVSNLTMKKGRTLSFHAFTGIGPRGVPEPELIKWAGSWYGARFSNTIHRNIANAASGNRPIKNMFILGHACPSCTDIGNFDPSTMNPNNPKPSFSRATKGLFPNRCSFTRNARVRAIGCTSTAFARRFARVYLRRGSEIRSTKSNIRVDFKPWWKTRHGQRVGLIRYRFWVCFRNRAFTKCISKWYSSRKSFHRAGKTFWGKIRGRL